ncbi:MAG: hypothetical protein AAF639_22685, partial [Chloroflexota bacterium]
MTVIIEHYNVPTMGTMRVKVDRVFDILINAEDARQRVSSWLVDTISDDISTESPELVLLEDVVVWRVPTRIDFLDPRHLGRVATVDV